jgi:predicted flap endonuclease-1-like 5' DNA nuclease
VRTASRRARRLGGLLLVAATVLWALLRRRANAVRWVEPPATTPPTGMTRPAGAVPDERDEPGAPGELPGDVLATDAGLTELPEAGTEGPAVEAAVEAAAVEDRAVGGSAVEGLAAGSAVGASADAVEDLAVGGSAVEGSAAGSAVGGSADAVEELPADTVDETRVAEILAESPDADVVVVDEATYELAVADAAPDPSRPADPPSAVAEAEVVATGPAAAQPSDDATEAELEDAATERSRSVPMPTFSEAPTAEIPAVTDDLRRIRGIGPSMERTLQGIGIVSYRQLALLDGAELERVRGELTDFRGRIEREDWVGQARALYREKYGRDPS